MADIRLTEAEQLALRSLMAAETVPGTPLPTRRVLELVATLIPCDEVGVGLADPTGYVTDFVDLPSCRYGDFDPQVCDGPLPVGLQWCSRQPGLADHLRDDGSADELMLGFRNGPDHVAQLNLGRQRRPFSNRDVLMLRLIAPLLQRQLREPIQRRLPAGLTVQERRVLQLVAVGWSNAQIADRMSIAPSTVRKHLEHAFPKLGVSNRLAAAMAFEGRSLPDPDRVGLIETFA